MPTDPDSCPHPHRKRETIRFGQYRCKRCGGDIPLGDRVFEVRHSPRVTLKQGDRVHVRNDGVSHHYSFKGTFQWAEGDHYVICEKQMVKGDGGKWYEATAAVRTVHKDRVRQDDGVRARRRREEVA